MFNTDPGGAVEVFPMLESWSEFNATWVSRGAGADWLAVGAAPPSRGATPIGSFVLDEEDVSYSTEIDSATVQGWVTTPASNLGIALTTNNTSAAIIRSRHAPNGKPFLRVTYVP